jgi:hypothetical protein
MVATSQRVIGARLVGGLNVEGSRIVRSTRRHCCRSPWDLPQRNHDQEPEGGRLTHQLVSDRRTSGAQRNAQDDNEVRL